LFRTQIRNAAGAWPEEKKNRLPAEKPPGEAKADVREKKKKRKKPGLQDSEEKAGWEDGPVVLKSRSCFRTEDRNKTKKRGVMEAGEEGPCSPGKKKGAQAYYRQREKEGRKPKRNLKEGWSNHPTGRFPCWWKKEKEKKPSKSPCVGR